MRTPPKGSRPYGLIELGSGRESPYLWKKSKGQRERTAILERPYDALTLYFLYSEQGDPDQRNVFGAIAGQGLRHIKGQTEIMNIPHLVNILRVGWR